MAKRRKPVHPSVNAKLIEFGAELEATTKIAGRHVTLRWLQAESKKRRGVPLPTTSVWRIFNGLSPEPDWPMISQVLSLCKISEQEINEQWRPKWMAMVRHIHTIQRTGTSTSGVECPTCGAAMLNEHRHREYHAEQESSIRRAAFRSVPTGTDVVSGRAG